MLEDSVPPPTPRVKPQAANWFFSGSFVSDPNMPGARSHFWGIQFSHIDPDAAMADILSRVLTPGARQEDVIMVAFNRVD